MTEPITWTARTVAEALDLLRVVEHSIQTGLQTANPHNTAGCLHPGWNNPLNLHLTFHPQPDQT